MKTKSEETAQKISRKDALKKAGMYSAFTSAASILILTPKTAQAQPSVGWGSGGYHGTPPGGGAGSNSSPFSKPKPETPPSGLKDSPWKKGLRGTWW